MIPRSKLFLAPLLLLSLCLVLAALGCGRDRPGIGTRAVVIGIDGADWKLIDELAAEGRMPNFSRLKAEGSWGPIATLPSIPLSPVIWTSVATGKSAAKHGITWFMVDRADGSRVPVRSYNRKVKAIWNILADQGLRAAVLGWWATYPAENVGDGVMISDALGFHGFGSTARSGDDARKTHPPELYSEVAPLVPRLPQIEPDFALRFLRMTPEEYESAKFRPAAGGGPDPGNPVHLFQQYAATALGYTAIAEKLLRERQDDLSMFYFEQVDSFSHLFMKYSAPKLPWIDEQEHQHYKDVVREWYPYQDEILGRLLAGIDLETTAVFILSDHGFKSGERRIRSEKAVDVRRAHLDHETHGIFLAAGPHIRRGFEVQRASVIDITPTVLYYLGLPVARDMDGKILKGLFDPEFLQRHPESRVDSFEGAGDEPELVAEEDEFSEEEAARTMEALKALGYVGGGEDEVAAAVAVDLDAEAGLAEESSPEIHNNLGRIYLRQGEIEQAREEFEQALALSPRNAEALLNLGSIERVEGRVALAERYVERALQVDPNSVSALCQLAEIKRDQEDIDESIRLYRVALEIDDSQPFVYLGIGDSLQRAGRHEEAEESFRMVLSLDPDSFEGHYNLGVSLLSRQRVEEAIGEFEKALELSPRHPNAAWALNNLADIHMRRGERDEAMKRFRQAVDASPRHLESRYNLGVLLLQSRKVEEAIPLLEQAASISPNHEAVNGSLGMAYMLAGRNDEAYRSFLLVRRLYPRNWIAPLGLALLHAGAGQEDRAAELLAEAIELGGDAARAEAGSYPILAEML